MREGVIALAVVWTPAIGWAQGLPGVPRVPGENRPARSPADLRPSPSRQQVSPRQRRPEGRSKRPAGAGSHTVRRGGRRPPRRARAATRPARPKPAGRFIGLSGIVRNPSRPRGRTARIPGTWSPARVRRELVLAVTRGSGINERRALEALANLAPQDRKAFKRDNASLLRLVRSRLSRVTGERQLARQMLDSPGSILSRERLRDQTRAAVSGRELTNSARVTPRSLWRLTRFLANYANDLQPGELDGFHTGQEWALREAIAARRVRQSRRLTPGEVLEEALTLTQGDVYAASLTAHNTIRALARGADDRLNAQVPAHLRAKPLIERELFGRVPDHAFMRAHLGAIRGGRGDEPGSWYHLFGTATMAVAVGETTAKAMGTVEETVISGDVWKDPLEPYVNGLGAELGGELRARAKAALRARSRERKNVKGT